MRTILAIALQSARAAVRSRLVATLFIVLALAVIGLPLSVKGDGTLGGEIHVLLHYTLRLVTIILGTATLWASCATIAMEIQDRTLRLVVVKPVRPAQLWIGKWFGLILVNAILLAVAGSVILGLLAWRVRPSRTDPVERENVMNTVLTARREVPANPALIEAEVKRRFQTMANEGKIPQDRSPDQILTHLRKNLGNVSVTPGTRRVWEFDLPDRARALKHGAQLAFRILPGDRSRSTINGTWHIRCGMTATTVQHTVSSAGPHIQHVIIPASTLLPGQTLVAEFANAAGPESSPVIIDLRDGVRLLIPEGSFGMNIARALVILGAQLALLAAIGLSVGSLLSFPVATFVAVTLLIMAPLVQYAADTNAGDRDHHGHEHQSSAFETVGRTIAKGLDYIVSPIAATDPLPRLANGLVVSWKHTLTAALVLLLGLPALLACVSVLLFHRREIALY